MNCERCHQGDRVPVRRAKTAESDGRVAVVLDIPMEECSSCGDRWLRMEVASRLDALFTEMLGGGAELATRHFEDSGTVPAA